MSLDIRHTVGEWLVDLLSLIGLAMGAGGAAAAPILQELQESSFASDPTRSLTPEQAAVLVQKRSITFEQGATHARRGGITSDHFSHLVDATGNPPGFGELLTLWRRGKIDYPRFVLGLQQGYTRNDWTGDLGGLVQDELPVGEAIAAAVQNHLPFGVAANKAGAHGVAPQDFQTMYDNAGNPPGPLELLNLWVRGYIDEATVDQGLRESRLKDKWIEPLKRLSVRKIPMRTITTLLNHGAITDQRAHSALRELGYSDEDAAAMIAGSHAAKATTAHELSVANIKTLYAERALPRDRAMADLATIGYRADVAGQLLDLADSEVTARMQGATITKIRAAYVKKHIDKGQASNDLDAIGVPAGHRDELLYLWGFDRTLDLKELTAAQIVAAGKKGILSQQAVINRLFAAGYSVEDAWIVAMLGGAADIPAQPVE